MFKLFKYALLAKMIHSYKKELVIIVASFVAMLLLVFMINDFIEIAPTAVAYMLIPLKWGIVLGSTAVIVHRMLKIYNSSFFSSSKERKVIPLESKAQQNNSTKESIIKKERLLSRKELLIQKYGGKDD